MSNENNSVQEIFHAARAIASVEQRQAFLDDACDTTDDLREQVEELLQAYDRAGNFLERVPDVPGSPSAEDSTGNADLVPTQPPNFSKRSSKVGSRVVDPRARLFGDYELLERIACGGMGMVYKARQISLNRIVAIKMILSGQFAGEEEVQRFYREAEAAANLDHPGIVPVFDFGSNEDQHYFSMGFVDGESLDVKLKEGPMSPRVAAVYVKKIAAAAHFAHEHGIVHRDLKPGNVLLDKNDEPRITDFGLAKRVEADSDLTASGMVMGTPCYMPPEQASGKLEQINASTDVYSLGAILYALLTGRPPFDGKTPVKTLMQVLHEEPIAPRQLVTNIPRDLEAICLKCLEKTPADRYQSAAELATDLQQFLAGEPIKAKNDLRRRVRKWTLREPVLAAHLVAILVLMAMIVTNYWLFGQSNPDGFRVLLLNQGILGAWALVAILLQKTHNAIAAKHVIPLIWAAINPVFLTVTLCANEAPRGTLLSLYLLLIVTTGFFRRVELVAMTTITSLAGYVALLLLFPEQEPTVPPPSYQVIFGASLIVTGVLLGFQTLRLKRLSQKDVV